MYNPSSPITGAAQTGFTSPTYTLSADVAPDVNGKQFAVTALGGTQAGVTAHSSASPFTATFVRPKVYKPLGKANPVTGLINSVPRNVFKHIVRKGVIPLAGQPSQVLIVTTTYEIPAGAETADAANIRAAVSLDEGLKNSIAAALGDTLVSGLM